MAELDPFSQVYNKIWDVLEANATWVRLVKPGNRIHYGEDWRGMKPTARATSDLPEAEIAPAPGGELKVHATSSTSTAKQNYSIRIRTGDMRVHKVVFPLKAAIFSAFAKAFIEDRNLGFPFVNDVRILDTFDEGLLNAQLSRGEGWESLYAIQVGFQHNTIKLAQGVWS